ncbi:hypothetical protein Slala03_53640 [Streptomyces lavendulae subsp. lavendulae]|nr:hypothetical protein Slala03_53640 [Streptomyces lavendulae subsp. lavendulae]
MPTGVPDSAVPVGDTGYGIRWEDTPPAPLDGFDPRTGLAGLSRDGATPWIGHANDLGTVADQTVTSGLGSESETGSKHSGYSVR